MPCIQLCTVVAEWLGRLAAQCSTVAEQHGKPGPGGNGRLSVRQYGAVLGARPSSCTYAHMPASATRSLTARLTHERALLPATSCRLPPARLMKAGFLPKHQEKAVAKASAWAEVLGYMGSIALSCHKLQQLNIQEAALARKLEALMKVGRCAGDGLVTGLPCCGCV